MPAIDPRVLVILVLLAVGYRGYEDFVKPVVVKVEHVVKAAGRALGKVVHRG